MARSYDIADIMTSDGEYVTDGVRRKINGNFRKVLRALEDVAGGDRTYVLSTSVKVVQDYMEENLPIIERQLRDQIMGDAYPVGCVIVTATASDPRLSMGTWQQVGAGRYVRAAGDDVPVMSTGGADSVTVLPGNLPAEVVRVTGDDAGVEAYAPSEAEPDPVTVEPRYVSLLFYRRVS